MKSFSAVLFASAVVASDAYGQYAAPTSSSKLGYTTVYPGKGYEPVTVTAQYQAIPTPDGHGKTGYYTWVSTVIKDGKGEYVTVTKTEQEVTLYHTKTTITHYPTSEGGYAAPTGYAPTGTGYYPNKNGTLPTPKPYYELYEKIHEAEYKELGPKALPNYPGSGLYKGDKNKQRVKVKEYKNGKWSEYYTIFDYSPPKPSATTFKNPGTYTIPEYVKTITKEYTEPTEKHSAVPAHKTITYGGHYTSVSHPTTITATYPAYETHGPKVVTVHKTKTVTCPHPGKYTIEKPTTTHYEHATTISYVTVTTYPAGTWTHSKETVTVTKSNQPYTCTYNPPKHTPTPSHTKPGNEYPHSTTSTSTGSYPDPSSDPEYPVSEYGTAHAGGYIKRGGVLERRRSEPEVKKPAGKRVILV